MWQKRENLKRLWQEVHNFLPLALRSGEDDLLGNLRGDSPRPLSQAAEVLCRLRVALVRDNGIHANALRHQQMVAARPLDYRVLLSVQQTCEYRGISFLKFLLAHEEDVEEYCRRGRKKSPPSALEVYPESFFRTHFKKTKDKPTEGGAP